MCIARHLITACFLTEEVMHMPNSACIHVHVHELYGCLYAYVLSLQYYRSPLHCACQDGNPDAAEILLQAGANVQLADRVSI